VDGGVFGTVDGLDGLAREGEELPAASGTGAGRRGTLRTGCRAIRGLRGSVHDNDLPAGAGVSPVFAGHHSTIRVSVSRLYGSAGAQRWPGPRGAGPGGS